MKEFNLENLKDSEKIVDFDQMKQIDSLKTKVLKYALYKKRTENEIREKFSEEDENLLEDVIENLKELKEFYVICKQQIRKSFSAAMFSCFAGFMLFVLAVVLFLLGGNNSASFMAGLSGAIVEIVSGLYFWMYKETSKQLGKYHKRLEATEKYLIALQIIEMLPEENRSEQYGKLIDYIFDNANKQ